MTDEVHRAAVLGHPIAHSLSPAIHRAGFAATGRRGWTYERVDLEEDGLAGFVAGLDASWVGLSLTMPLKEVGLAVADSASATATALGAANTLVPRNGGWYADNTDAPGMVDALRGSGRDHRVPTVDSVAVLGAGGTGRAALGAAAALGVDTVTCYVRRPDTADEALRPVAERLGLRLVVRPWAEAAAAAGADLVVSTVPAGGADELTTASWRRGGLLLDVIYDPWPTKVAAGAAAAGCRVVSGLDLLFTQAVRQFVLFTGERHPPVAAMSAALDAAVAARA